MAVTGALERLVELHTDAVREGLAPDEAVLLPVGFDWELTRADLDEILQACGHVTPDYDGLTLREAGVLAAIAGFLREHRKAPTVRELGTIIGLGVACTHDHLRRLQDLGRIQRDALSPRSIRVVPKKGA